MANVNPFAAALNDVEMVNAAVGESVPEGIVRNDAGGLVYQVDDMTRLRRFLILGSDGECWFDRNSSLCFAGEAPPDTISDSVPRAPC
jgi:hypothetical protein